MTRPNDAPASAKEATLNSWEEAGFQTWSFWGTTTVHLYNTGNTTVTARLASGAGEAFVAIDPGEDKREKGRWGGLPLFIANTTQRDEANNQYPQVEVWVW